MTRTESVNYTVQISDSGVAHVYLDGKPFCSVHHLYAGGLDAAKDRANDICNLLNESEKRMS